MPANLSRSEFKEAVASVGRELSEKVFEAHQLREAARQLDAEADEIRARGDALYRDNPQFGFRENYGTGRIRKLR